MDIGWFRDLIICIWGFLAIIFLIVAAILIFKFNKKMHILLDSIDLIIQKGNAVLTSLEETTMSFQGIVNNIREEVTNPLIQIMAIVQGVKKVINIFSELKKK